MCIYCACGDRMNDECCGACMLEAQDVPTYEESAMNTLCRDGCKSSKLAAMTKLDLFGHWHVGDTVVTYNGDRTAKAKDDPMNETFNRFEVIGYGTNGTRVTFVVRSDKGYAEMLPGCGSADEVVHEAATNLWPTLDTALAAWKDESDE